ncbi:MAG: hypothetical protein IPG10_00490 [Flavobacteriales bacterium]|nr:hypothetical protein [Flavobacteriales bacterium]
MFEGSTEPNQNSGFERNIIYCGQNVLGTTDNPQDVMISDNIFRNGYAAMELDFEGFGGARSQGLIITDNLLENQYATGITVQNAIGRSATTASRHRTATSSPASAPTSSTAGARSAATRSKLTPPPAAARASSAGTPRTPPAT